MKHIKLFENFGNEVEEFNITDIDEIDGMQCKDFKVKELKVGDKIYMKLIDPDEWINQFAKNVNNFENFGLGSYSKPTQYEVVEINDNVIKLRS